jgi:hypothetical protein
MLVRLVKEVKRKGLNFIVFSLKFLAIVEEETNPPEGVQITV